MSRRGDDLVKAMEEAVAIARGEKAPARSTTFTPRNLVHIALATNDPTMLTSPDGKRVEVDLDAIVKLLENPPPMLRTR